MIDLYWPFPSLLYPLTPPEPKEYLDYALFDSTEIKTEVVTQNALL